MISQHPTIRRSADGVRHCRCRHRGRATNRFTCWWTAPGSSSAVPVSGWHAAKVRRSWRKLHIGVDADTGEIIAAELTSKDDGSQVGPCWSRLRVQLRRLPATGRTIGTMSTVRSASVIRMRRSLCRHARARCQAQRQRPRRPKRDRHLQLIAERGRMGWQRASGYNWRALVEADIGRYKRVIGDALRSRIGGRQTTEVAIAVASLNRHARAWPAGVRSPSRKCRCGGLTASGC